MRKVKVNKFGICECGKNLDSYSLWLGTCSNCKGTFKRWASK